MDTLASAIKLNIICWNLHAGIDWYGRFNPEQLLACLRAFQPDLCGFQEVDRHWGARSCFLDLAQFLATGLAMYPVFSSSLVNKHGTYGNLILSRYPLVNSWWQSLPDSHEQRSFCCAQVLVGGVKLNFLTTHLGLSAIDRCRQAERILGFISGLPDLGIICGDFNAGPDDNGVQTLLGKFRDLHTVSGAGTFRLADGRVGPRIDYILVTPEFVAEQYQVISNYCSDHLPLFARLGLERHNHPVFYL